MLLFIIIHYVCFKDKLDGFVPTHFFGWWLKVSNYFTVIILSFWKEEQSDQGLHCLLFHLHLLDEIL